jgi:hypothetical protein
MAHPNEELVRRGYDAFNNADVETLRHMMCWPTTSTLSGCTALTPNEMVAVFAARPLWCSMCAMAGSQRPGRTITTSTNSTSSGRR